jgi:hypothetical protein
VWLVWLVAGGWWLVAGVAGGWCGWWLGPASDGSEQGNITRLCQSGDSVVLQHLQQVQRSTEAIVAHYDQQLHEQQKAFAAR